MTNLDDTLKDRSGRYGDFSLHAAISDALITVCQGMGATLPATNFNQLDPVKKQALRVICDKIGRILAGDPNYRDNWHDIQGYAKLAEDRCVDDGQTDLPLPPVSDGKTVDHNGEALARTWLRPLGEVKL